MGIFHQLLHIGANGESANQIKKIKLLNAFILIRFGLIPLFLLEDYFLPRFSFTQSLISHGIVALCLSILLVLQLRKKFEVTCVVYMILLYSELFYFSYIVQFSTETLHFYMAFPLVSLIFLDRKYLNIFFLVLAIVCFTIPRHLLYDVPLIEALPFTSVALFLTIYIIVNYFKNENSRNEKLLTQQKNRLAELDQVKSNFFANISHEFRTPLTLINGLSNRLIEKEGSKEARIINRNGEQLLALVNQLLELSRIESGQVELKNENIDIISLVNFYVQSYHSLADDKGIKLKLSTSHQLLMVSGDQKALARVIQNILSNALKFTKKGTVDIHILKDKDWVKIIVEDTGIGIESTELVKIFDRFYQVNDTETRDFEGTGIGLALCKELVDLSGAKMEVESTIGVGTRFEISWPQGLIDESSAHLAVDEIATINLPEMEINDNSVVIDEQNRDEVLIVEDNLEMSRFIKDILTDSGYSVLVASNGKEGFKMAIENIPDFIVSDWMMPQMVGPELIEKIKGEPLTSHIPCMLLTAKADENSKLLGLKVGAEAYLTKPFNNEEFLIQVDNLIRVRKSIRQSLLGNATNDLTEEAAQIENEFLIKVKDFISENIDNPVLDAPLLADHFNYSRSQFAKKLKALSDKSVNKFIYAVRIDHAEGLLKNSSLNISEIAYMSGFNHSSHFSRMFTELKGLSPSEFRNNLKGP